MKEIKTSPIFYQGCKKKLIKKGLIDLFPKNIGTFYDLFGGSGIVSMNVEANNYVLNDLNSNLFELYKLFKNSSADDIIEHILSNVNEFSLRRISISNDDKNRDKHKQSYFNLRNKANKSGNIIDLYTTIFYSFSQQMRFNSKGKFNMPCGNNAFTFENEKFIKQGCEFFVKDNVKIYNKNYLQLKIEKLKSNDFVYLDPPYLDTTATYNEQGGWTIKDENEMYELLEEMDRFDIKWGMSNSFASKGKVNQQLIDWCNKNNWDITHFDVKYSSMGKGNANNDEVYICNYEVQK